MLSEYVYKNHQKLRYGYTTGSCAAAAAKAAVRMLLTGRKTTEISIRTPKGIDLSLLVEDISIESHQVSCAIRKDSGDDADCTNGILIYATVSASSHDNAIVIDGGKGIGRITKSGLEQPVGNAAINNVPRKMIEQEVRQELSFAKYDGGIHVLISAPQGEEIAKKTFNPRLGIEGGISILGTSGIVEPMSEAALIETIRLEIRQKKEYGSRILLLSPGNYGQQFTKEKYHLVDDLEQSVKCSNFIGETLDIAWELGFERILLIGHIGKLIKLASGIMNTHSKMADARLETLCSCAILAGCDIETARNILLCTTTDDALGLLSHTPYFSDSMQIMLDKILFHLQRRTEGRIQTEVIVFSNVFGILAESQDAEQLIAELKNGGIKQ